MTGNEKPPQPDSLESILDTGGKPKELTMGERDYLFGLLADLKMRGESGSQSYLKIVDRLLLTEEFSIDADVEPVVDQYVERVKNFEG